LWEWYKFIEKKMKDNYKTNILFFEKRKTYLEW